MCLVRSSDWFVGVANCYDGGCGSWNSYEESANRGGTVAVVFRYYGGFEEPELKRYSWEPIYRVTVVTVFRLVYFDSLRICFSRNRGVTVSNKYFSNLFNPWICVTVLANSKLLSTVGAGR